MPKRKTTCALSFVDKTDLGELTVGVNGKAAAGATMDEWSVEWDDGELEDGLGNLPAIVKHAYLEGGTKLIVLTVRDSKNTVVSQSMNVFIVRSTGAVAPILTVLSPSTGAVGSACTLTGLNFGATQGTSFVRVNGVTAVVDSWSATSIDIHIPTGATTGSIIVTVSGLASNGMVYTVIGAETYDYIVALTSATPAGSDSNAGTLAAPFATITHAIQVAAGVLTETGKTIGVRAGTYDQAVTFPAAGGTSWTNKIRVVNYNAELVWLKPSSGQSVMRFGDGSANGAAEKYLEFDGINLDALNVSNDGEPVKIGAALAANSPSRIRWMNLECKGHTTIGGGGTSNYNDSGFLILLNDGAAEGGFEFINVAVHGLGYSDFDHGWYVGASNCTWDTCEAYDLPGAGIQLQGYASTKTNTIIKNCTIHDSRSTASVGGVQRHWGIIVFTFYSDVTIYNCSVYGILKENSAFPGYSAGIINGMGSNVKIYFNTVVDNQGVGIYVDSSSPPNQTTSRNNIAFGNGQNYLEAVAATDDHNLFGTDPLFVNQAAHNYHLTSGSPARGIGLPVTGITLDRDGVVRTDPPDVGAYQFV